MSRLGEAWERFLDKHETIAVGAAISAALLVLLLIFQALSASILSLETRWLLVAATPLLIALLAGGYIKSFKGFGVEIEASLRKPVSSVPLTAVQAMQGLPGDVKKSMSYLNSLSPDERMKCQRLSFTLGRTGYVTSAVKRYLNEMPNLQYLEIKHNDGSLAMLYPAGPIREDSAEPRRLVEWLKNPDYESPPATSPITATVSTDTELMKSMQKMHAEDIDQLGVVDSGGRFQGILTRQIVAEKIIEEVIAARERS